MNLEEIYILTIIVLLCSSTFHVFRFSSGFRGASVTDRAFWRRRNRILLMDGKSNVLRERIITIKKTKKITDAMRLVAAAKVRRAQDAVLRCRPFSETVQSIFAKMIRQIEKEDIQLPLFEQRAVNRVIVVGISGDRGLCGAYNSQIIRRTEARVKQLLSQGINVDIIPIGKKITQYFRRRSDVYTVKRSFTCGKEPSTAESCEIAEELLTDYICGEADSVEMIYTKFVSLILSKPAVRTLLPLKVSGIEDESDELFQITSEHGKFAVVREPVNAALEKSFNQDFLLDPGPIEILNVLLPLYLNGQILRILHESIASELASRMQAMAAASDNAGELASRLTLQYNRARQASVTQELMEIVAGANASEQ